MTLDYISQQDKEYSKIGHLYLSRSPLSVIENLIEEIATKHGLSSSSQEQIFRTTIKSRLASSFPASVKYQLAFCKKLIGIFEKYQIEIIDDIYESYTNLLSYKQKEDLGFTIYLINGEAIIIRDTDSLVQEGTTGLFTWEAGKEFVSYSLENAHLFRGKSILELGSGTGLTGNVICSLIDVKHYYFTDCAPKVISSLKATAEDNLLVNYQVLPFRWESEHDKKCIEKIKPDLIIGCDLVYDPRALDDLLGVIRKAYQLRIEMIFLFTDRKTNVLSKFDQALNQLDPNINWTKEIIRHSNEDSFYHSPIPDLSFRLYKINTL